MNGGSQVKFWLAMLLGLVGLYGGYSAFRIYRLSQVSTPSSSAPTLPKEELIGRTVHPFQLTDQTGSPFDSKTLQGKVWVASFFFSNCPGACLKMNNRLAELQAELVDDELRFVSITVDPDNDTPQELARYAAHYHADPARWLFLTGPAAELRRVSEQEFLVAFGRETHSSRLMVVDRKGVLRGAYSATDGPDVELLKRKLAEVLKEGV